MKMKASTLRWLALQTKKSDIWKLYIPMNRLPQKSPLDK